MIDGSGRSRGMARRVAGVMLAILGGLALWLAGDAVVDGLRSASDTDGWSETSCHILSATSESQLGTEPGGPMWHWNVRYEYWVAERGQVFSSSQVDTGSDELTSDELMERWHEGEEVRCWYDPAHPENAVLDRGWSHASSGRVAAFVLLAVGCFLGVAILRSKR